MNKRIPRAVAALLMVFGVTAVTVTAAVSPAQAHSCVPRAYVQDDGGMAGCIAGSNYIKVKLYCFRLDNGETAVVYGPRKWSDIMPFPGGLRPGPWSDASCDPWGGVVIKAEAYIVP